MNTSKQLKIAREEAIARLHADGEAAPTEDEIADGMADVLADWAADAAVDRELYGEPLEAESIASCDCGTGEGQFHGRI